MNRRIILGAIVAVFTMKALAGPRDFGTLIFEDRFERSESQELKDEPGNGWTTSSDKTAKGNKQIDLRDGHAYVYTHAEANHATSFRHAFSFKDGTLGLRFMLDDEGDSLKLNFADMDLKTVWAGHLFFVDIGTEKVRITDQKTGEMNLEIRNARKENALSESQEKELEKKTKVFRHELDTKHWHQVYVTVEGDLLSVTINGKEIGSLRSEGFGHETKGLLRLLVPKNAHVDDVEIWRRK